jgi:hypothetical protein
MLAVLIVVRRLPAPVLPSVTLANPPAVLLVHLVLNIEARDPWPTVASLSSPSLTRTREWSSILTAVRTAGRRQTPSPEPSPELERVDESGRMRYSIREGLPVETPRRWSLSLAEGKFVDSTRSTMALTTRRLPQLALAQTRLVTIAKSSRRAVIAPCRCGNSRRCAYVCSRS